MARVDDLRRVCLTWLLRRLTGRGQVHLAGPDPLPQPPVRASPRRVARGNLTPGLPQNGA